MAIWLNSILNKATRDNRGNVATIFAVALVPVVGLVGGAIDYSNAARQRAQIQAAFDAAALAGSRAVRNGPTAAQAEAAKVAAANLPPELANVVPVVSVSGGTVTVAVNTQSASTFLKVLGINSLPLVVRSQATQGAQELEIALVLDNTGSMRNDMASLRRAASRLSSDLMAIGPGVRISVVPYAAAVNPGRAAIPLSMVDVLGLSRHHAQAIKWRWLARTTDGCRFPWENNNGGGGGGGGGGSSPPDNGGGNDRSEFWSPLRSFASGLGKLLGIGSAHASGSEVTPNTREPYIGRTIRNGAAFLPDGFINFDNCGLSNPSRISHLDLFARIPNATWKGCVEARPEPYDVTDDVPNVANADSLFVPYFAIDEADASTGERQANDYMADGPTRGSGQNVTVGPNGWEWLGGWERTYSIFKYNGVARARISENGGDTWGPNANCPDEILPLTNDAPAVQRKISGLTHWSGGGTISSEGVMWGWRVLSPGPPFTEGRPYGDVPKIIVLMSDGQNSLVRNNDGGAVMSDYTAYGFLRNGRFPEERFDSATSYLDDRMRVACTNAKRAGITVYSVLFRERAANARALMRDCSTDGRLYYEAMNSSDLDRAFADIAASISKLRLSQ